MNARDARRFDHLERPPEGRLVLGREADDHVRREIEVVQRLEPAAGLPPLPPLRRRDQWHYALARGPEDRIQHGIDHDSYVYQLALDMGAAPGVTDLARISWRRGWRRGWNIIPSWAFVSQVNPKFRLVGPWRWDGAADVLHGEMWSLVQKNGGFVGE